MQEPNDRCHIHRPAVQSPAPAQRTLPCIYRLSGPPTNGRMQLWQHVATNDSSCLVGGPRELDRTRVAFSLQEEEDSQQCALLAPSCLGRVARSPATLKSQILSVRRTVSRLDSARAHVRASLKVSGCFGASTGAVAARATPRCRQKGFAYALDETIVQISAHGTKYEHWTAGDHTAMRAYTGGKPRIACFRSLPCFPSPSGRQSHCDCDRRSMSEVRRCRAARPRVGV